MVRDVRRCDPLIHSNDNVQDRSPLAPISSVEGANNTKSWSAVQNSCRYGLQMLLRSSSVAHQLLLYKASYLQGSNIGGVHNRLMK